MLTTNSPTNGQTQHVHLPIDASQSPSVSPREFKDSMAKLAFSICVVAARHADEQLGRTVTSFMPLSVEPPHMIVSIDVRSRLIDLIGFSRRFSVSFLATGQQNIADIFAGKGSIDDRFSISEWDYWPSGTPKLAGALVSMDCKLVGSIDASDHMLFVGAVIETEISAGAKPLMWNERDYLIPVKPAADD